jgi:hypothetical protein
MSQNPCHKLFLDIPRPPVQQKKFLSTWVQKWTGFEIPTAVRVPVPVWVLHKMLKVRPFAVTHPLWRHIMGSLTRYSWPGRFLMASNVATMGSHNSSTVVTGVEQTLFLTIGLRSGERGGHATSALRPIPFPGKWPFRYLRAMRLKC